MKRKATTGTVSHATMRKEDLIPAFLDELKWQGHSHGISGLATRMRKKDYFETEDSDYDLEDLFNRLDEFAPPYFYFGAHPGDGSDYGYWLHEEWEEMLRDGDGILVSDLADIPSGFVGEVAVVNDHGNVTLYRKGRNGHLYEVWSVV